MIKKLQQIINKETTLFYEKNNITKKKLKQLHPNMAELDALKTLFFRTKHD